MKSLTAAMQQHIQGDATTLATCWKLVRKDGFTACFTDHDQNLTVDGLVYIASTGMKASSIKSSDALDVDNLEVDSVIDSVVLKDEELLAGAWDDASVLIFQVNWQSPAAGKIVLRAGRIGEVKLGKHRFNAELRGMSQPLQQKFGRLYTVTCDADFGDSRCKLNLGAWTFSGSVTAKTDNSTFTAGNLNLGGVPVSAFAGGKATFTSGPNAGFSMEIKSMSGGLGITLQLPMSFDVQVGNTLTVTAGCTKTLAKCQSYNNVINFRGFPHIPGNDRLMYPGTTR